MASRRRRRGTAARPSTKSPLHASIEEPTSSNSLKMANVEATSPEARSKKAKPPCSQNRCRVTVQSSLHTYLCAVGALSAEQKEKIIQLGFGKLLEFKLDSFVDKSLLEFLMERIDLSDLVIRVGGNDKILPINDHAVRCVLGLPTRQANLPLYTYSNLGTELKDLKSELGVQMEDNITKDTLIKKIKEGGTDELTIRCFFLIMFNKILFTSSQNHITGKDAARTRSTKDLAEVNWAKVVVDDIRDAVKLWHKSDPKKKRTMSGCPAFLLIYYVDHLNSLSSIPCVNTPRAACYSGPIIRKIIATDKNKNGDPFGRFGHLNFRSMANTCYSISTSHGESNKRITECEKNADLVRLIKSLVNESLNDLYERLTEKERGEIVKLRAAEIDHSSPPAAHVDDGLSLPSDGWAPPESPSADVSEPPSTMPQGASSQAGLLFRSDRDVPLVDIPLQDIPTQNTSDAVSPVDTTSHVVPPAYIPPSMQQNSTSLQAGIELQDIFQNHENVLNEKIKAVINEDVQGQTAARQTRKRKRNKPSRSSMGTQGYYL